MMHLLVDPVLYAVPTIDDDKEAHIDYIDHLSQWSDEFREKKHHFYVWPECIDALNDAGCFPYPDVLKQLWARVDEHIISYDYAFAACCRLLEPPNLPDWIKDPNLYEMLVEDAAFQIRPDLLERLPSEVAEAFQQTLGKVAYIKEIYEESPISDLHLVTHPVLGEPVAIITAEVMTHDETTQVNSDLPLITSPDDLDALQDIAQQWQDVPTAIAWTKREMIRKGELPSSAQLAPFAVDPEFATSIERHQFDKNIGRLNKIYRQCVLLLTGNILYNTEEHHFLGKPNQRRSGEWRARRLHITKSPSAIRLHYWHDGQRFILMEVLGHHDHFAIDEPPSDAFR